MRQFDVIIERDEQGLYVGSVPLLPGCHTQGRSLDELMQRMREAVELCLEVEGVVPLSLWSSSASSGSPLPQEQGSPADR